VNAQPPPITISNWSARESGTLVGFFTAALASGLILNELMLHYRDGQYWISFPSKPKLSPDGVALRDDAGKVRYGAPLIEFASRADRDRFMAQVLKAFRAAHPEVLADVIEGST
jgi:hypothetical protein